MAKPKRVNPGDLTKAQEKAWNQFEAAVKACKRAHIKFYQVLDTVCPLNGNIVEDILTDEEHWVLRTTPSERLVNMQRAYSYGSVRTTCGFADDTHTVLLKEGYVDANGDEGDE